MTTSRGVSRRLPLEPMPSVAELKRMAQERGVLPSTVPAKAAEPKWPTLRPWAPFRSKWELEYSRYLDLQKAAGMVGWWAYEPDRLQIGVGAFYTPDFLVKLPNGVTQYREVKGYKREAAMVRLKAAAFQFPESRFVLVTKKQGAWVHTTIGAK